MVFKNKRYKHMIITCFYIVLVIYINHRFASPPLGDSSLIFGASGKGKGEGKRQGQGQGKDISKGKDTLRSRSNVKLQGQR